MAFLNSLAGILRMRPPAQKAEATGAASGSTFASVSAGAASGGAPVAAAADTESVATEGVEPSEREKSLMLHLSNVSHACNHFQNQMMTMLYPYIMVDLGMTYTEVGVLSAVRSVFNSISQGACGFLTPFVSRCKILGFGNFGIALGTFMSGVAGSYPMLVVARVVGAIGSSAQHPVGYSILSSYFPKSRGSVIAMNTSASNVGTWVATPLATAMLLFMGWRHIFFVVAFASIIMGLVYFYFRDYGAPNRSGSGKARLAQGVGSYKRVLKNHNMVLVALVFMVGAASGEGSINQTYFAPHLANDFGYSALMVGILITSMNTGQIVGPIIFGWLSDRLSRKGVLQSSLALSSLGTLWVAFMGPGAVKQLIGLFFYSAITTSRGTLTQAIIADSVTDQDRDAAFSMYFLLGFLAQPLWVLVTGYLMDRGGFSLAMSRVSVSYVLGIMILYFVKDLQQKEKAAA